MSFRHVWIQFVLAWSRIYRHQTWPHHFYEVRGSFYQLIRKFQHEKPLVVQSIRYRLVLLATLRQLYHACTDLWLLLARICQLVCSNTRRDQSSQNCLVHWLPKYTAFPIVCEHSQPQHLEVLVRRTSGVECSSHIIK